MTYRKLVNQLIKETNTKFNETTLTLHNGKLKNILVINLCLTYTKKLVTILSTVFCSDKS